MSKNRFLGLHDAREKVGARRRHYNQDRPHHALGSLSPREFTAF